MLEFKEFVRCKNERRNDRLPVSLEDCERCPLFCGLKPSGAGDGRFVNCGEVDEHPHFFFIPISRDMLIHTTRLAKLDERVVDVVGSVGIIGGQYTYLPNGTKPIALRCLVARSQAEAQMIRSVLRGIGLLSPLHVTGQLRYEGINPLASRDIYAAHVRVEVWSPGDVKVAPDNREWKAFAFQNESVVPFAHQMDDGRSNTCLPRYLL